MGKSSTSGQGRPKGAKNKATGELQDLARTYTADALKELGRLALKAESETARVAAINSLLDRGYGKPNQAIAVEAEITHTYVARIPALSLDMESWSQEHGAALMLPNQTPQ